MTYAMFIDYEYCSGCHTCEVACQKEQGLEPEQFGIQLTEVGPEQITEKRWQRDNLPYPLDRCDACIKRLEAGKRASCEQHCQADCIRVGKLADMAALLTADHQVIFTLLDQEATQERFDKLKAKYYGPVDASNSIFDKEIAESGEGDGDMPIGTAGLSKDSKLKEILANEQAVALLESLNPGCTSEKGIKQAAKMGLTLAGIQKFASDVITDEALAIIDAKLREL